MTDLALDLLASGPLQLLGRILPASNHTFLCQLGDGEEAVQAVYKPVSGERPLWDFTDGTLAQREYAAYLVSEATGWSVVPPTTLREGPVGPGMVQLWQEVVEDVSPVDVVPHGPVPDGYLHVLDAFDGEDRPVSLIHEDSVALRRMALYDIVVNNTDRKGGHVLPLADGRRLGVDHGVCFHSEDKLRTVLWGWAGRRLCDEERVVLDLLAAAVAGELGDRLRELLTAREVRATRHRIEDLRAADRFPLPSGEWPAIPWPPF